MYKTILEIIFVVLISFSLLVLIEKEKEVRVRDSFDRGVEVGTKTTLDRFDFSNNSCIEIR